MDGGTDASNREQTPQRQGDPSERPASRQERGEERTRDRKMVAEQARVHRLGQERADVKHEKRTCAVVQVAEGEVQQERGDRCDNPEQQLGPAPGRVRGRR